MNLIDITLHIKSILPLFTDILSVKKPITTISKTPDTDIVTVNCMNHQLQENDQVLISGVKSEIVITDLTSENGVVVATCERSHELWLGPVRTVKIQSAEQLYTGVFEVASIVSDTKFTFNISLNEGDDDPLPNTGTLLTYHTLGFNGVQKVKSALDDDNFTYENYNENLTTGAGDNMLAVPYVNIAMASSVERAEDFYSKRDLDDKYLFICHETSTASNSRFTQTDSSNEVFSSAAFHLKMINTFSCYLFTPSKNSHLGAKNVNLNLDFLPKLYKVLAGYKPKSSFSNSESSLIMPLSHGVTSFNTAYMIYRFEFELTETLRSDADKLYKGDVDEFLYNTGDSYSNINTVQFKKFTFTKMVEESISKSNSGFL